LVFEDHDLAKRPVALGELIAKKNGDYMGNIWRG
jgi:hypothetical protein